MDPYEQLSVGERLAIQISKRTGRMEALQEVMTEIYDKRFDYEYETVESRDAYSRVWFKMQAKYLAEKQFLETIQKALVG